MKNKLDTILNKLVSRKLSVFIVACFGLFSGNLDSGDWVIIGTAYISIQGITDIVQRIKFDQRK
jgi:hypothetical protein